MQLKDRIDEACYVTRIYCYEGYVREWFAAEEVSFDPAAGERISPAEEVSFSMEEGCLLVTVKQRNGTVSEQMLTLRSDGGEAVYEK